jgi:anti-sigma regulatory factor (Ser/Thr protein kinase)
VNPFACPAPRWLASFALASMPGSEPVALTQVAYSVADLNLPPRRLDKLQTAVAEATMNAIEQGNDNRPDLAVDIEVFYSGTEIIVTISDHGGRGDPGWAHEGDDAEIPDLDRKLSSDQWQRGWGLFLIRHMVDGMEVTVEAERRTVRLTMGTPVPGAKRGDYDASGGWSDGQAHDRHGGPDGRRAYVGHRYQGRRYGRVRVRANGGVRGSLAARGPAARAEL